ncbi:MAG TPA: hypothetical protein VJB96_03575 [Patescibacteria group bacterium]|nr:hypothetical protein [Patescibacteria group bacterium]
MNKPKMIAIALIVAVATAGAGFYGGMKYQQSKRGNFVRMTGGQGNPQVVRQGFRPVSGEIIKSDVTSITVKLNDGSSKIIMLTSSTRINKAAESTKEDLTTGIQVAIFGSENADGSITAQNVQINPTRPSQ